MIWRILIFYIGALLILMSLVAWNHLDPKESPFVVVFDRVGIPGAAGIVNFVVLTAALSSCNSGIFSTGRMLYTLAGFRQAPAALRKVSRQKVPALGLVVSFSVMLVGVAINYFIPSAVSYVTSIARSGSCVGDGSVLATRYGATSMPAGPESEFRMPSSPAGNWFVLGFLAMVLVLLAFNEDTVIALYVAPVWVAVLLVGYFASRSITSGRPVRRPQPAPTRPGRELDRDGTSRRSERRLCPYQAAAMSEVTGCRSAS